jgi:hypothetical protein
MHLHCSSSEATVDKYDAYSGAIQENVKKLIMSVRRGGRDLGESQIADDSTAVPKSVERLLPICFRQWVQLWTV